MTRLIRFVLLILASLMALVVPAAAQLEIDITKGNINPVPIAVPDFVTDDARTQEISADMAKVIRDDLSLIHI